MELSGSHAFGERGKHLIDKLIYSLIPRKKYIATIAHSLVSVPAEGSIHMAERLNTGDKLYPERSSIFVYFAKLALRISAAFIAEKRLSLHFICILSIEHGAVVAHF